MINLRDYQHLTINELGVGFKTNQRQILRLDTGGGKTVIFSEICSRAVAKGSKCLIVTDRKELFEQAIKAVKMIGLTPCIINAENKLVEPYAMLFIAMVESVKQLLDDVDFKLIIIDEAHKGCFFKLLDKFPNTKVIGATATPTNKKLVNYYTNIVDVTNIPTLINQGYLAPIRAYQAQDNFNDVITKGDDFEVNSLYAHFDKPKRYSGVIESYNKYLKGKKTLVFCVNVEHSNNTAKSFNDAGISAYSLTSNNTSQEREIALENFENGTYTVLVNCGILTTGYDNPSIVGIILDRATLSLSLYLQMCGRGSRMFNGKDEFIVLDFGMNNTRFGLWDEVRNWELLEEKRKKKGVGAMPIKECSHCNAMIPAMATMCSYCFTQFDMRNIELIDGVLVEIKPKASFIGRKVSSLNIYELIEANAQKLLTIHFIWRVIRSYGVDTIKFYAKIMCYEKGWVNRQIGEIKDSNYSDITL